MATSNSNKFPPKYDRGLIYPAIYNLDEMSMPQDLGTEYGDVSLGAYFNVSFAGNQSSFGFGKHSFTISAVQGVGFPPLKHGSRILFEFKDSAGTIIYSDTTPFGSPYDLTGYFWVKQDPIRTYDDIQEGTATLTIVAQAVTTDNRWKKHYNVRTQEYININLYEDNPDDSNTLIVLPNTSPILMQSHTGSVSVKGTPGIGSGSGHFEISEERVYHAFYGTEISNLVVSASNLYTYSGKIEQIQVDFKRSGSIGNGEDYVDQWNLLGDHPLTSSNFEDDIGDNYSAGINTLSEKWKMPINPDFIPINGPAGNKYKFRLRFKAPLTNTFAEDPFTTADEYVLEYPSNYNEWLVIEGSAFRNSGQNLHIRQNPEVVRTAVGQYSFKSDSITTRNQSRSYDSSGNLVFTKTAPDDETE